MNTLMAGTKTIRGSRGRYTAAGYQRTMYKAHEERRVQARQQEMYIASVPAGSRQDELRDRNRIGYRSSRPWNEPNQPLFDGGYTAASSAAALSSAHKKRSRPFFDTVALCAAREKRDVVLCVAMVCAIVMLSATAGQWMLEEGWITREIGEYVEETKKLEAENVILEQQLVNAKNGERIRNIAQNELYMLRPERAQTETIYIQNVERSTQDLSQQTEEPRMELLDFLLGLLNVFQIGE